MDNKVKNKTILICIVLVVSYLVMYIISLLSHNAIMPIELYNAHWLVESNVKSLLLVTLMFFIPFEKIVAFWYSERSYINKEKKLINNNRNRLIEAVILYFLITFICIIIQKHLHYGRFDTYERDHLILLSTLPMVFILANTYEMIQKNVHLLLFDTVLIISHGIIIYSLSNEFTTAFIGTLSLSIAWNICNFINKTKNAVLSLGASVLINIFALCEAINITGRYKELYAFFEPGREHIALRGHSLNITEVPTWEFFYRHPFSAIYSHLGLIVFLIFILAFIAMSVACIYSGKILSKKRYNVMLIIYIMGATLFLYTLMADLGFVPTASTLLINSNVQIIYIGLMIRLFVKRDNTIER